VWRSVLYRQQAGTGADLEAEKEEGGENVKRKIASRKLKRVCEYCGKNFNKGDVYYINRYVFSDIDWVIAFEFLICPKCKWKSEQRKARKATLPERCKHPIIHTEYSYIPGECVMEPAYDYCAICGKVSP
jgi:hypothetical protein